MKRDTGCLEAKPQGNGGGHGKLAGMADWIGRRIKEKRDLTLDELVVELLMNWWSNFVRSKASRPTLSRFGGICAALA